MPRQIAVGYDPTVAGLAAEIGEVVSAADGSAVWTKTGPGVTDWEAYNDGDAAGVVATIAPGAGMSVDDTDPENPIVSSSLLEAVGKARAQSVIPTINHIAVVLFDRGGGMRSAAGGSGVVAGSATVAGAMNVTSGVSSGSSATAWAAAIGTVTPAWTASQRTGTYYLRFRARFNGGLDANTINTLGLTAVGGGAPQIRIGYSGSISTTNFSVVVTDAAGATAHSANMLVAGDTSWHTFEIWNNAGAMSFAIDGGTIVPITNSAGGTAAGTWLANAVNGGTAAARDVDVQSIVLGAVAS